MVGEGGESVRRTTLAIEYVRLFAQRKPRRIPSLDRFCAQSFAGADGPLASFVGESRFTVWSLLSAAAPTHREQFHAPCNNC